MLQQAKTAVKQATEIQHAIGDAKLNAKQVVKLFVSHYVKLNVN